MSAVVLGQCSNAMKAKLKVHTEFKERYAKANCVWLLVTIRATMLKFEGHQYIFLGLQDVLTAICNHQQGDNNLTTYRAELESLVQADKMYGGKFSRSAKLMDKIEDLEGSTGLTTSEKSTKAHDRAVALKFLQGADKRMCGTLWVSMQNNYSLGLKQYPTNLTEAYTTLLNYIPQKNSDLQQQPTKNTPTDTSAAPTVPASSASVTSKLTGVSFAQAGTTVPGMDGATHAHITCFTCNSKGHYASVCPAATGTTNLHTTVKSTDKDGDSADDAGNNSSVDDTIYGCTFTMNNGSENRIPDTWILLDSQSTVSIFHNKEFLRNIRSSPTKLVVDTNGGKQISTMVGDLKNFGPVWYNPESIANILSHADVAKQYRITSDSAIERSFHVHKADGTLMTFTESPTGLYF
jgi:hypothetical protein